MLASQAGGEGSTPFGRSKFIANSFGFNSDVKIYAKVAQLVEQRYRKP